MFLRFIPVVCIDISFLLIAGIALHCMRDTGYQFTHSPGDGHLGCFPFGAIRNHVSQQF